MIGDAPSAIASPITHSETPTSIGARRTGSGPRKQRDTTRDHANGEALRSSRVTRWTLAAGAMLLSLIAQGENTARADEPLRYDVRAAVDTTGRRITIQQDVANPQRDRNGDLHLWLYAERARHAAPSLDDLSAERLYPGGLSQGGFERVAITVEGCPTVEVAIDRRAADPVRGRVIDLRVCSTASLPIRAHVDSTLTLPERFGTLGHSPDGTALADPWYPLFLGEGATRPARATHTLSLALEDASVIVSASGAERAKAASVHQDDVTHVSLMLLDHANITSENDRGVDVTYVTRRERVAHGTARNDPTRDGDPFDPDATRRIESAVKEGVAFLRRLGFTSAPGSSTRSMRQRLVVVEASERQRIGVSIGGLVIVSDRAFRLLPVDRIERFHRDALLRHVFASLVGPHVRAIEDEADIGWVEDLDGSLLTDLFIASEQLTRESAKDLIGFAGFHPAVDQLLYAPQVAFRSAYFHEVDEVDPDRDGALRALNQRPFGHLMLEKLRDHLEPQRFGAAVHAHLFEGQSWRSATSRTTGESTSWFFDQWLLRRRRVAYRLAGVSSLRTSRGFEHRVQVQRLGEIDVREPVTVEVVDDEGHRVRGRWDSAGAVGFVTIVTPTALRDAQIDPDGRLTQDPTLGEGHPRFDDELRHGWRPPVFNNFAFGASVLEARPDLELDFSLKRRYDVRNTIGLRAVQSYRGTSASVRYTRGIGDLRDLNNVDRAVTSTLGVLYSNTGYGGSSEDVTAGYVGLSLSRDTRKNLISPSMGQSLSVGVTLGVAHSASEPALLTATLSARGQRLFWPHLNHTLAVTAGASMVRCPALPQSLAVLSGRQLFRGYELDELLGCGTAYAMFEERWTVLRGVYVNAADIAWGRRLDLVPFVGAGLLSSRTTLADIFSRPVFDAGLGLRAFYDYFGVQPGILSVDVGLPLSRTNSCASRNAAGACRRLRQPLGLYLSFEQTF